MVKLPGPYDANLHHVNWLNMRQPTYDSCVASTVEFH